MESMASSSYTLMESMASSSSSSSSSSKIISDDAGPLFELSELMAQLPIKRGLSKYYDGKSQTFECMESVKRLEDLKKGRKRLGLMYMSPKATISKKKNKLYSKTSVQLFMAGKRSVELASSSING